MKCPSCSNDVQLNAKFCPTCGAAVETAKATSAVLGDVGMFKGKFDNSQHAIGNQLNVAGNVYLVQPGASTSVDGVDPWDKFIQRYKQIRDTEPSSNARTAKLDALVMEMIKTAPPRYPFDIAQVLSGRNSEYRLAGYVFLCAHPDPTKMDHLLKAVVDPQDGAFCQYWGLQAIAKVIGASSDVSVRVYNRLRKLLTRLEKGNRAKLVAQMLAQLEKL